MNVTKHSLSAMATSLILVSMAFADDDNERSRDDPPRGDPFEAWAFDCGDYSSDPGEIRTHGPKISIQNLYNQGPMTSTDPRIHGPTRVIVNVKVNTETNKGKFWGSLEVLPSAYQGQGSWVGIFDADIPGKPATVGDVRTHRSAIMVAHGTGVFEGLKIRFEHFFDPAIVPPPVPAGCTWTGELWRGEVIELGN